MDNQLQFAKTLAYEAGKIMLRYFNQNPDSRFKEDDTPVTIADEEINQMAISQIQKAYPEHGVYGEEQSHHPDRSHLWLCDPIDGTSMFTRGVPVAVFSIALVIDGEPILGVIYDPFTDRLYEAVKGGGAFCNNQPIHVNQDALNTKTSGIDFGYSPTMPFNLTRAIYELNQTNRVFAIGSFAHGGLLVAYGATVASVTSGSRPYDVAAVKVIVEEAGGKVTDIYGNEQRYDTDINGTIISNGVVHDEIVKIIRETQGS